MRILLTGAAGFLGSYVLQQLVQSGHAVTVVLRPQTKPWRIADLLPQVRIIKSTIADMVAAPGKVEALGADTLIHLAWGGVGNKWRDDVCQLTSLHETVSLVACAPLFGIKVVVATGSQAEYGRLSGRCSESHATAPTTLYGATKLAASGVVAQLCKLANMRYAWLRVFSTYGPKDDPAWMLPDLIGKLLRRERPALTEGRQRWDYLYAEDAARAIVLAAADPAAQGVFNLGSGEARVLRNLVTEVRNCIDPSLPLGFGEVPYRADQVMHLEADIARLRALGWAPQVSLEAGLRLAVEWYRDHPPT